MFVPDELAAMATTEGGGGETIISATVRRAKVGSFWLTFFRN